MARQPETIHDYLREHPELETRYRPPTLADIADEAASGDDFLFRIMQFLDDFRRPQSDESRSELIRREPPRSRDARWDAFLGALAEHLAAVHGLSRPRWSTQPWRFLDVWWFVAGEEAFVPLAIVESPAAFRRRGVFIAESLLFRV